MEKLHTGIIGHWISKRLYGSPSLLLCICTGQQQIGRWVPESGTLLLYSQDDMAVRPISPKTADVRCTKYDSVQTPRTYRVLARSHPSCSRCSKSGVSGSAGRMDWPSKHDMTWLRHPIARH